MRDSKSFSFLTFCSLSNSKRGLLTVLPALTLTIGLSGCAKMADQPVAFRPIAPPSMNAQQNENVQNILQRQDAIRKQDAMQVAAEEAATEVEEELASAQQEEIVDNAAIRATTEENEAVPAKSFGIAQVSFETEIDETSDEQDFEAADESSENVRLTANVDDLQDVPQNIARAAFPFSGGNLLRAKTTKALQPASMTAEVEDDFAGAAAPEVAQLNTVATVQTASPLQLPLQPMLFNPTTRETKTNVEGTLRPMVTTRQEIEPEVGLERAKTDSRISAGPLTPIQPTNTETIKLTSTRLADTSNDNTPSRLLSPIDRSTAQLADPWSRPKVEAAAVETFVATKTPQVSPNDFKSLQPSTKSLAAPKSPQELVVSEQIIVVDRGEDPAAEIVQTPPAKSEAIIAQELGPIVDAGLANAQAAYLQKQTQIQTIPNSFIPPEVFRDADALARDVERELVAAAIPVGPIESSSNQFKVRTISANTCESCKAAGCTDCKHELGKPLTENNDFAAPQSPSEHFVAPMTVTPAEVPIVVPMPFEKTSDNFGGPIRLQAPPETDSIVAHVAALPTNGASAATVKSNVPPVGIATMMELDSVTWKSRLDEAIELAQQRLDRMSQPSDADVVNLRLLRALRGQMEQMETTSGEIPPTEARYWQHQLEAITSMLGTPTGDTQALTDYHRHQSAHTTLAHLRNAVSQLESIASLRVGSGQFCTEITGFGQFRTFDTNQFKAGQKMLVYCEVENYRTVENQSATGSDFRTRLRGSFAIYDAGGKVVQQAEYPTVDDVARKRRRDFYMYMPVTLGDLPAGEYVMHALVEDIHGNKTASLDPPLPFSVR